MPTSEKPWQVAPSHVTMKPRDKRPMAMPEDFHENLGVVEPPPGGWAMQPEDLTRSPSRFSPGVRVRITEGVFASMSGRVLGADEIAAAGCKPSQGETNAVVWVLIEIFGRPVPVELLPAQLELM